MSYHGSPNRNGTGNQYRNRNRNLRRKKQSDRERLITAHVIEPHHDTVAERKRIEQLYAESVDYFATESESTKGDRE